MPLVRIDIQSGDPVAECFAIGGVMQCTLPAADKDE